MFRLGGSLARFGVTLGHLSMFYLVLGASGNTFRATREARENVWSYLGTAWGRLRTYGVFWKRLEYSEEL